MGVAKTFFRTVIDYFSTFSTKNANLSTDLSFVKNSTFIHHKRRAHGPKSTFVSRISRTLGVLDIPGLC